MKNLSNKAKFRLAYIDFYNKTRDATLVCKTFKISRPTFYKWYNRYDPNNLQTLEDEPKTPKTRRTTTLPPQKERRIKKLREANMFLGKDKLQVLYKKQYSEYVSTHHIQYVIQKYNLYPDKKSRKAITTKLPSQAINETQLYDKKFADSLKRADTTPTYPQKYHQEQHPQDFIVKPRGRSVIDENQTSQVIPQDTHPKQDEAESTVSETKREIRETETAQATTKGKEASLNQTLITPPTHKVEPEEFNNKSHLHKKQRFSSETEPDLSQEKRDLHGMGKPLPLNIKPDTLQPKQRPEQSEKARVEKDVSRTPLEQPDLINVSEKSWKSKPDTEQLETEHTVKKKPESDKTKPGKPLVPTTQILQKQSRLALNKKALIAILVLFLFFATAAPTYFFYAKYQEAQKYLKDPTLAAKDENRDIVSKISKFLELPTDEEPTIATVSDKEKLKNQPFFEKAKEGDKVIIYNNAKIAILYDPIDNKIVSVAPIKNDSPTPTNKSNQAPPSPQTQESPINVVLYNGTNITGLTHTVEKDLNKKIKNIDIVSRANSKEGYIKSLVIDLSGNNDDIAQNIASALKAEIGKLPDKEIKPVSKTPGEKIDILVIIGKEYTE